jgi:cytosine/adenosine deaminase-related metal-dependent hydrolase
MIIRARAVVTMAGPPIENGAVAIDGDRIVAVGRFDSVKREHAGEVVDLGEQALLPGLINAHCHLDYTCLRGAISPQPSFADWIRQINARKAALSPDDYVASVASGFAEAQRWGTTSIANMEAFPELIARFARPSLRTWWFPELIDVRTPVDLSAVMRRMRESVESERPLTQFGLSPHAPYTASAELYGAASQLASRENILLTTHLAESQEEMEMFRDGRGELFGFMRSIGRPMNDCGDTTPLRVATEASTITEDWIVAHLNELTETDFELLARAHSFSIAHCPRSHAYFGHTPFRFNRLRDLGFNICIGTDSLASNFSLSLFEEMRELQRGFPTLPPQEILAAATTNGARALKQDTALGRIRTAFFADLIAVPLTRSPDWLEQIVAFDQAVSWLMMGGKVRNS